MLQNHDFSPTEPMRHFKLLRRLWLPLAVATMSLALLAAEFLGLSSHIVWIGSTALSGFVMSYVLFALIQTRRRAAAMHAKLDAALAKVRNRYRLR